MRLARLTALLRKFRPAPRPRRSRWAAPPLLERLEDRLTPSVLIPVTTHRDLVFDASRNQLDITTSDGKVQSWNVGPSPTLANTYNVGASLYGADITPDGASLYVTEGQTSNGNGTVHQVNLSTGAVTNLTYALASGETGSYSIAVGSNGKALFDGSQSGSGPVPLRQINLSNDALTTRPDAPGGSAGINQNTRVVRSADRSQFYFTGANGSNGPSFTYNAAADTFSQVVDTNLFLDQQLSAVNRNGTLIALEMPNGAASVMDANLHYVKNLPAINGGLVFDPNQDVLYGVSTTTGPGIIVAFDTNTWAVKYTLPIEESVSAGTVYGSGEMAVSADSKYLFLATPTGVREYPLPPANGVPYILTESNFPTYIQTGVPGTLTLTVRDPAGNIVTGYRGTVQFSSSDAQAQLPAPYTFTAADNGVHTFTFTLNTAGTQGVGAIDPINHVEVPPPPPPIVVHAPITSTTSVIPVSTHEDLVYDPNRNILYITSADGTLQRYDIANQTLLPAFYVGVSLLGGDITPDGKFFYVADNQRGATQGVIHKVDLTTGAVTDLSYAMNSNSPFYTADASWDVALANGGGFVDEQFEASGGQVPLLALNTSANTLTVNTTYPGFNGLVSQSVVMRRSADRTLFLFVEGSGLLYSTVSNSFTNGPNLGPTLLGAESGVNRNGTLVAADVYGTGIEVFDPHFNLVKTLNGVNGTLTFDPVRDLMYVANGSTVTAYNTGTWAVAFTLAIGESIGTSFVPFGQGTMAVNADGSLLFIGTPSGVRVLNLPSGGSSNQFAVSGFPTSDTAGAAGSVTVKATDAQGNVLTNYTGTVHFTSSDPIASLPTDYTFTAGDAGVHTFTNLVDLRTAGTESITVTDTANGAVYGEEGNIVVAPAPANHFAVAAPASATAGTAFTFTVTALDPYNNIATGYGGTVHFSSSDGAASLPANATLSNGTGSFSATLKTAGGQTLTATDTAAGATTGTSGTITVSAAAATHFAVSAPAGATAGTAFTFTVTAVDAYGNTATGYGGTVHFTSTDPQAALPFNSTLTSGTGSFSATLKTAGGQTLTATDTAAGATTGTSGTITVSAAAATQLVITAQPPSSVLVGAGFGLGVSAEDTYGNLATSFGGGVTVALASGPAGARLGGTLTVTAASGVASFAGLTVDTAGGGYALQATAAGLSAATTSSFTASANASSLALSNSSVPEFRPVGTLVGTLSTSEAGSGHTFTYSLVSGTGSADNASFTISGNQLVTADAFVASAKSSYAVRVRSTDENNQTVEAPLTITVIADPSLSLAGTTLTVSGTAGNDVFSFTPGAVRDSLTLNGTALAADAAAVKAVVFNGGGGSDSATLTGAPGSANALSLSTTSGTLSGTGYSVTVNAVAQVIASGHAGDRATLTGSSGSDVFVGTPSYAKLYGSGFLDQADGFGVVLAFGGGGSDTAYLYDSAGNDAFVGTPTYSYLNGSGFFNQANGFSVVVGNSTAGGTDYAYLYGAAAGGNAFVGTPIYSYLYGGGFFNQANGFKVVVGTAAGANNTAQLYAAAAAGNVFVGTPTYSYLYGTGFFNQADGFSTVYGNSEGGADTAYLYDSPGNDVFVATSTYAYLYGTGFYNQANGFRAVYAYATAGGSDQAYLLGTGTSADTYLSGAGYAELYGNAFLDLADNFGYVYANPYARR